MLLEILFSLSILFNIFFSTMIFYGLRRINLLENFILEFQQIIEYSSSKLKDIDNSSST